MRFYNFAAYIGYYFFMSSFLWLNVICFDMFWTFWYSTTALKASRNIINILFAFYSLTLKSTGTANLKRFKFYSLYAWLGSLVMTILLILASFVLDETHPLFSDIGREKCFADNGGLKPGSRNYKPSFKHNLITLKFLSTNCVLPWAPTGVIDS